MFSSADIAKAPRRPDCDRNLFLFAVAHCVFATGQYNKKITLIILTYFICDGII